MHHRLLKLHYHTWAQYNNYRHLLLMMCDSIRYWRDSPVQFPLRVTVQQLMVIFLSGYGKSWVGTSLIGDRHNLANGKHSHLLQIQIINIPRTPPCWRRDVTKLQLTRVCHAFSLQWNCCYNHSRQRTKESLIFSHNRKLLCTTIDSLQYFILHVVQDQVCQS